MLKENEKAEELIKANFESFISEDSIIKCSNESKEPNSTCCELTKANNYSSSSSPTTHKNPREFSSSVTSFVLINRTIN